MSQRKLKRITLIGLQSLLPESKTEIESYADEVLSFPKRPETKRLPGSIGDSEAVLISTHVKITKEILEDCPNLKYIGVYAKSLSCVDLDEAKQKNITVTGFTKNSDWETAEFCIATLLQIYRGLSPLMFSKTPLSLKGKTLGIIGFGKVGQNLAKIAASLGMTVIYSSPRRKEQLETEQIQFKSLEDLIEESEIISLHGPAGKIILEEHHFQKMERCRLLINTSLGTVFNFKAFEKWITKEKHFAVFDDVASLDSNQLDSFEKVYLPGKPAWKTQESIQRKDQQLLENLRAFLKQSNLI